MSWMPYVWLSAAGKLLAKQPEHKANFSRAHGAVSDAKLNRQTRFPVNPEPNWGPKPKHKRQRKVRLRRRCTKAEPGLLSYCELVQ